jgi:hypothetical protein
MLLRAAVLLALVFAPSALADGGPAPGVVAGGTGVLGDGISYVTVGDGRSTILETLRGKDGVAGWVGLRGNWGIPSIAFDGTTAGLSRDRGTLILGEFGYGRCSSSGCSLLRSTSRFAVFTPKTLRHRATIALKGDFSFDALSPDGRKLYLIQHVSERNLNRYLVRAYDLERGRLLPEAIADRTQRGWVMQGVPAARATSANGRFVYTLYQNPGGYPFVHALDTVRGVAHCTGIPWTGSQTAVGSMKLTLHDGGRTLSLAVPREAFKPPRTFPSFTLDTRTYAVSQLPPGAPGGFPWWTLGLVAVPPLLGSVLVRRSWRTRLRWGGKHVLAGMR